VLDGLSDSIKFIVSIDGSSKNVFEQYV
jgi:hypothetical protein